MERGKKIENNNPFREMEKLLFAKIKWNVRCGDVRGKVKEHLSRFCLEPEINKCFRRNRTCKI